jgi:hypothetical protein
MNVPGSHGATAAKNRCYTSCIGGINHCCLERTPRSRPLTANDASQGTPLAGHPNYQETLHIAGRDFHCTVVTSQNTQVQIWYCDQVPGGVVRRLRNINVGFMSGDPTVVEDLLQSYDPGDQRGGFNASASNPAIVGAWFKPRTGTTYFFNEDGTTFCHDEAAAAHYPDVGHWSAVNGSTNLFQFIRDNDTFHLAISPDRKTARLTNRTTPDYFGNGILNRGEDDGIVSPRVLIRTRPYFGWALEDLSKARLGLDICGS